MIVKSIQQIIGIPADMNPKRCSIILVFVVSTVAFASAFNDYHSDKILLSDLKVITLHQGQFTNARRSSPVPQLKCVGGSAQHKFQPKVVQCINQGSDGYDIQWECKTDMDNAYRFGHVGVSCEGYDYPNDPFVLKGSCGLEYTIEFTEEGLQREKHGGNKKSYHYESKYHSDNAGGAGGFFIFAAILFVIFIIYKICLAPDTPAGYNSTRATPTAPPQPPPYGFRPEFTGQGQQDYPPPPYETYNSDFTSFSGTPGHNSHYSSHGGNQRSNTGDGFWTGAATGGVLGYLFGSSRNNGQRHGSQWGNSNWNTQRDNNSGFSSSPPPSPRSSVLADDFCYFYTSETTLKIEYCTYGCCHEYGYKDPCCGLSGGMIAGIAIAIIIVTVLVVVAIMFARRRYSHRSTIQQTNSSPSQVISPPAGPGSTGPNYGQPPPYGTLAFTPPAFLEPPSYAPQASNKSADEAKPNFNVRPNEQPPPYTERAAEQTPSPPSH